MALKLVPASWHDSTGLPLPWLAFAFDDEFRRRVALAIDVLEKNEEIDTVSFEAPFMLMTTEKDGSVKTADPVKLERYGIDWLDESEADMLLLGGIPDEIVLWPIVSTRGEKMHVDRRAVWFTFYEAESAMEGEAKLPAKPEELLDADFGVKLVPVGEEPSEVIEEAEE